MKKNKIILFDWGNIVESHVVGYTMFDAYRDLFKEFGCVLEDKADLSEYHLSSISSLEDFEPIFYDIKEKYHLNCDFSSYLERYDYYFSKITYYEDVRDYEISLSEYCYIGILSNLALMDKKRIDAQLGLDNYDYVFLSFEMECQKPDSVIFDMVSKKLPFESKDILFIDDSYENIEMAKKYGWNTRLATGLEFDKIKEACEKFIHE